MSDAAGTMSDAAAGARMFRILLSTPGHHSVRNEGSRGTC